jgi:hypothetical protein
LQAVYGYSNEILGNTLSFQTPYISNSVLSDTLTINKRVEQDLEILTNFDVNHSGVAFITLTLSVKYTF